MAPPTQENLLLASRYELVRELGRGGFAEVWLAKDLHLAGKEIALKILRVDRCDKPAEVERFGIEPLITSQIRDVGGHIVNVTDAGYDAGLHYFVMEYIEGETLREMLCRRGRLPYVEMLQIAVQLCDGIAAAHDYKIAHRDLKPENIMLVPRRGGLHVMIVDLGIAKLVREHELRSKRSAIIGTPTYMAPEVITAEHFPPTGYFLADIYAVGVILYEVLVGSPPFCGELAQVLYQKVEVAAPCLRSRLDGVALPRPVEKLIMRCLERRPEERFASMEELAGLLRSLCAGVSTSTSRPQTRRLPEPSGDVYSVEHESSASETEIRCTSQSISLANEGKVSLVSAGATTFVIHTKQIRAHERGPHTLGLSSEEGPLPSRLRCTYSNGSLGLYVDSGDGRVALYLDATQPSTRMEQLLLTVSSPPQSFEVGHRRHQVRRVEARVLILSGPCEGRCELCFAGSYWVEFVAPPWVSTIITLETTGDDLATKYIECICLDHHK